jgi:nitrogenase molybdenum-iron protein beta chain
MSKSKNENVQDLSDEINYDFIDKPRFSCGFAGAFTTLTAIPGYVPIIHGGPGCGVSAQMGQTFLGGFRGSADFGGVNSPSTNTYENEIVFGGEDRLEEEIRTTFELIDGKQYVVLTVCTAELVGDDVAGVLRKFQDDIPISHASTAGFKGSGYIGYEILLDSFVDQIVEEGKKNEKLVNILGIVPSQDAFWEGNLTEIERILNLAGLEVNTLFNGKDIKDLSKASLNIVLSPWVGVDIAKKLEDKFNTPYIINPLPIGIGKTSEFLKKVGNLLNVDVDDVIEEEEKVAYHYIEKVGDLVADFDMQLKFATVTDANYTIGVNNFFTNEIGWIPSLAIVTDNVDSRYHEYIEKQLDFGEVISPKAIFNTDAYEIWNALKTERFDVLFGSSIDNDFVNELHIPNVSIAFPITDKPILSKGFSGYKGTISLLEDAFSTIVSALF